MSTGVSSDSESREGAGVPAGPVARGNRIASLDIIRGIAVLGILLANITGFAHSRAAYYWPPALPGGASAADDWIWLAQFTLVDGKMRGLFALLFGAGLALFASRAGDPIDALTLQGRRLFWLGLFGIAHYALLFDGDILFIYATGGFVALLAMGPSGFVAVIAGWITTEVGRQPWVIYGFLRTADAASPLDAPAVAVSLLAFVLVYFAVFGAGVWYILHLMHKPPHAGEKGVKRTEKGPVRTAGITPGPTQNPHDPDALPRDHEEATDGR